MRATLRPFPGLALMGGLAVLAACAHQAGSASNASGPLATGTAGQVGYVNLDRLVKKHPLYSQLARLDQDMEALRLKSVASSVAVSPADLDRAKAQLDAELDAAAKHAQDSLNQQQTAMQAREQQAIRAALAAAVPAGGGSIASGINANLADQQARVRTEASGDFEAYRKQLIAQDDASLRALETSYNARAAREYRARANALQQAEAAYALKLADDDKAERLSLRTKLSNLPLDDAERADTRTQLEAIDRRESDELGQMRNRDQATLAELQGTLRDRVRAEVDGSATDIRNKTVAKISAHAKTTQALVANAAGGTIVASAGGAGLPPDMQARLRTLQSKFQTDFLAERNRTVADFKKTKADLTVRFARLSGVDRDADAGVQKQLDALQKQRGDMYDGMVAEIEREVRSVAQKRGIDVVFSDVVAPAGGVDLTADAEKDIESLP